MDDSQRPAKKARIEGGSDKQDAVPKLKQTPKWRHQQIEHKRQQRKARLDHPQPESTQHRRDRELFGIDEDDEDSMKTLDEEKKEKMRKLRMPQMFSQPSVMTAGDKGIFVTCDKGREKKCLAELADLVEDYLEHRNLIPAAQTDPQALLDARLENQEKTIATREVPGEGSPLEEEVDIESSIHAEITGMQSPAEGQVGSHQVRASPANIKQFQLITLDVPCVSFLRFLPNHSVFEKVDVVDLVTSVCQEAAQNRGRMRSRYIKRLSPVTWLGKILSDGLDKACEEVLPPHFSIGQASDEQKGGSSTPNVIKQDVKNGIKFAIRPTIRNNKQVSRDEIIKQIATKVQQLGQEKHKVDLTGYEKCILVDVYRGWISMSVVSGEKPLASDDNIAAGGTDQSFGYESLKRFNLSEIYVEGLQKR